MNRHAVQAGTTTTFCGKHLVARGIVQYASFELVVLSRKCNRNAKDGIAVSEVGGAIQRIDQPTILCSRVGTRAFFSYDAVLGPALAQPLDNKFFGAAVGHRN